MSVARAVALFSLVFLASCIGKVYDMPTPAAVTGTSPTVRKVFAGFEYACGVVNGAAYCWGENSSGNLGDGTAVDSLTPVPVQGFDSGVTMISAMTSGYSSGRTTCGIKDGGDYCWGGNAYGQIGDNSTVDKHVPTQVVGLTSGVTDISVGHEHACAVMNGAAYCWGENSIMALGDGTTTDSHVPIPVAGLNSGVTKIAAGYYFSCAIHNGVVKCWGSNDYGYMGDGTLVDVAVPQAVPGLAATATEINAAAWDASVCAIVGGGVHCWGYNWRGTVGNGIAGPNILSPYAIPSMSSGVTSITSGDDAHTCAIKDATAYCWGNNSHGEIGDGTTTHRYVPTEVVGTAGLATSISGGAFQTCAVLDNELYCWGLNAHGGLGDGTTVDSTVPAPVEDLP